MPDKVSFRFKNEPSHAAAAKHLDELAAERGCSPDEVARELLVDQLLKSEDSRAEVREQGAERSNGSATETRV